MRRLIDLKKLYNKTFGVKIQIRVIFTKTAGFTAKIRNLMKIELLCKISLGTLYFRLGNFDT
jgi:hypothetical protein